MGPDGRHVPSTFLLQLMEANVAAKHLLWTLNFSLVTLHSAPLPDWNVWKLCDGFHHSEESDRSN